MKRVSLVIVAVLVSVALFMAACGGGSAKPAAAPTRSNDKAVATTQPAKAAQAEVTEPAEAAQEPTAEPEMASEEPTAAPAGGDTLSLQDRTSGLDKLNSYRVRWASEWSSTENGKTDTTAWDWTEEYSSDPKAVHWVWQNTGAESKGSTEWWQIGDTTYMKNTDKDGKGNCTSFSSEDQQNQIEKGLFNPSMLGSLNEAKFAGNDTVNGVAAKHYKYDEKSGGLGVFGKVNGEVWVATDGGYVVKDQMNWEGGTGLFGAATNKASGKGKWTWEISDANKPISIQAPENCGGGAKDLPMMPIAKEKMTIGDMSGYKTVGTVAEAAAFYQKEMPAAGWTLEGEPTVQDQIASLQFSKDGQKVSIQIMGSETEGTQVLITVEKATQ